MLAKSDFKAVQAASMLSVVAWISSGIFVVMRARLRRWRKPRGARQSLNNSRERGKRKQGAAL